MTFPLSWPERLYGLVVMLYPRAFRRRYENEMRMVFREVLRDPAFGRLQVAAMVLRDSANGILRPEHLPSKRLAAQGIAFGLLIVAFSVGAQVFHPGHHLGVPMVPVPFVAFVAAGFWGARRTRSIAGGVSVSLIAGATGSTMVLWDKVLFGIFPFQDLYMFTLGMLMMAGFCLGPAIVGAVAGAATAPLEEPADRPASAA